MNPNGQLPADYLDQIAPTAQKSQFLSGRMRQVAFIGIVLVVLVIIASIFVGLTSGGKKDDWARLSSRIASTNEIVADANRKIKSNRLRTVNSEVRLFLINLDRDIQDPLSRVGVEKKKISASIMKEVSSEESLATLDDARLNAVYDRTYSREMTYKLAQLLTDIQKVYNSSGDESIKEFLNDTYNSLEPLHETLSEYSASND